MDLKSNLNNNDMNDNEVKVKEEKKKCSEKCITNDMNIKIDDKPCDHNSIESNGAIGADDPKIDFTDPLNAIEKKEVKTYDFFCTIFYSMVALLVLSTLSRSYTVHSGNCYGTLFGVQSLLAYASVGLACTLIRSLRKSIKELQKPDDNIIERLDEMTIKGEKEPITLMNGYQMFDNQPLETPAFSPMGYDLIDDRLRYPSEQKPKTISYTVDDRPYGAIDAVNNKLSGTVLPLPLLPPPSSHPRRQTSAQKAVQSNDEPKDEKQLNDKPNDLSLLSVTDLKPMDTKELAVRHAATLDDNVNELDSVVSNNEYNDMKYQYNDDYGQRVYHINDLNWNNYDLNSYQNKF